MKKTIHILSFLTLHMLLLPLALSATEGENDICQAPPVADFVAFGTSGCGPLEIKFFDQSQGDVTSWNWSFPGADTTSSDQVNPIVVYDAVGTYPVSLEVSNADGSDQITKDGYVTITGRQVVIDFSFENTDRTITFQNNSQWSDDFSWDFGDGNFSTERAPIHTYDNDGTYIVRLKGTNECDGQEESEIVILGCCGSPVNYTANDRVTPYKGSFRPGTNLGYNPPWSDEELADIAAGNESLGVKGAGCKTIRPALNESFLEEWGYDIRFETYQHYGSLGLKDLTAIVGFPSPEHQDPTYFCSEHQSELFANMYTPIWDNGENGTPINDTNYLALYLFKTLHLYKDNVKFWEIWNEPGFDYTFTTGWLGPGQDGNWWENDPTPCDYKLRAPIYHYIRTLRISYEIIKTIDPDAYVTLASVGYTSFLDAVLRNTDNPTDGSVNADYPLGGGAYFDAIAIHSYPHLDGTMREWDQSTQSFVYDRHSDRAVQGIPLTKDTFQVVLDQYGYDGVTYPEKEWIITEINVPRKAFADYIGSDTVQINYIIKAYVESVINDIRQIHVYDMAESFEFEDAVNEFQLMGLYKRLFGVWPYNERINHLGVAYKTASDMLFNSDYDPIRSAGMELPAGVRGEAFLDHNGHYTYVLWAATTQDMSEESSATYSFPSSWNLSNLQLTHWNHSYFPQIDQQVPNNIALTATPIFLKDTSQVFLTTPLADFAIDTAVGCLPLTVQFQNAATTNTTQWEWTFEGGTPSTSNLPSPTVSYEQAGTFDVVLRVSNAAGSHEIRKSQLVSVNDALPVADFGISIFENVVTCSNNSSNATDYKWDMGTGEIRYESNPTINYPIPGLFTITLVAFNGCGSDTSSQTFIIDPDALTPIPDFRADKLLGCAPMEVQFTDLSTENTTDWWWFFEGGTPQISTEQHPVVTFEEPGTYFVRLIATNAGGLSAEAFKGEYITVDAAVPPIAGFETFISGGTVSFSNLSTDASSYLWDFGDGTRSTEEAPTHNYQDGNYTVMLISYNFCETDTSRQNITIVTPPLADFGAEAASGCAPLQVQFEDRSSDNATSWNWTFEEGDPTSSTEQHPVVTYNSPGSYRVSLEVSNDAGDSQVSYNNWVVVNDEPISGFAWQLSGKTIRLTATATRADSLRWDFGDGSESSELNPVHTYADNDTYTVKLEVFNECGMGSRMEDIRVNDEAVAGFEATQTSGCIPFDVQFSDRSSDNTLRWEWQFPGGTPSSSIEQNPSVTYEEVGLYDVSLKVWTATDSNLFEQVHLIRTEDAPSAAFEVDISVLNVRFNNLSQGANRYFWDFGDGNTSTEIQPEHSYANEADYEVFLTAYNDCDSSSYQTSISLTGIPQAAFSADLREGCHPLEVRFTDESSDNTTGWNWNFPGGTPANSQEQNPVVVYDNPGVYSVSLEVSNGSGSNRNEQLDLIRVIGQPEAAFDAQFLGDSTVAFSNQSTDADRFIWYFADGNSSELVNPTHQFPRGGDFFVQLIAFNQCGSDTITQPVSIPIQTVLTAAVAADRQAGCAPLEVSFRDQSTGQPERWEWQFPGGQPASSSEANPLVTYNESGQYDLKMIVYKGSEADTLELSNYIQVNEIPEANFAFTLTARSIELTNNSLRANDYAWSFGDGNTSNLAAPTHTYASNGVYQLQLIVSNECGKDTLEQEVNIQLSSLSQVAKEDMVLRLFPNPNDGQFTIWLEEVAASEVELVLYNSLGKQLQQQAVQLLSGKAVVEWDASALSPGLYWLEIKQGKQSLASRRVIIQP
ncbi:MAG: PKD domain-containing protein [Bacteroidota bacterium]